MESFAELKAHLQKTEHELQQALAKIAALEQQVDSYDPGRDVAQMMLAFDQQVNDKPTMPDAETRLLRAQLVFEEALEFVHAIGCEVTLGDKGLEHIDDAVSNAIGQPFTMVLMNLHREDLQVVRDPMATPDLKEAAKELADCKVVVYGSDKALGLPEKEIFAEVHRSNLSKVWPDGHVHKNEHGKVQKPPHYSPADLSRIFNV